MRSSKEEAAAKKAEKARQATEKKARDRKNVAEVAELEADMAQAEANEKIHALLPLAKHARSSAGSAPSAGQRAEESNREDEDPVSTDSGDDYVPVAITSDIMEDTMTVGDGENYGDNDGEETPKPKAKKNGKNPKGGPRKKEQAVRDTLDKGEQGYLNPARVDLPSDAEEFTRKTSTKADKKGKKNSNKGGNPGPVKASAALVPGWIQAVHGKAQKPKTSKPDISNVEPAESTALTHASAPPSRATSSSSRTTTMNPVMAIKKEPISTSKPKALSRDPVLHPELVAKLTHMPSGLNRVPTEILEPDDADIGFGMPQELLETEHNAALSSPIKGNNAIRLSHKDIVSVTPIKPNKPQRGQKRREATQDETEAPEQESKRGRKVWSNKDLPSLFQETLTSIWRPKYITSIYVFAGSHTDPWATKEAALVKASQDCLDKIYGNHGEKVVMEGPTFFITNQRVMEWRSGFGSTALEVVDLYFAEEGVNDRDLRKEASTGALKNLRFLYSFAEGDNESVYRGLFRSEIYLRTLAHHVSAIHGHVCIPALGTEEALRPRTAMALAATAVERAFTFWTNDDIEWVKMIDGTKKREVQTQLANGTLYTHMKPTLIPVNKRKTEISLAFDSTWKDTTTEYMNSVGNLEDRTVVKIMDAAAKFAKLGRSSASRAGGANGDGVSDDVGPRANLVYRSDSEEACEYDQFVDVPHSNKWLHSGLPAHD
ncbi:hypothetical protein BD410DRAFT_846661 [Rickenella mellea]|uniref:Uncharacterized protein n=1 Tax=Rickenella mellea TaxID=50990 RepID=A0A4Y7PFC9_9AGAM|nr:hypothetical protein BD410DRAFT_846661 [Rickenella mellea]